MGSLGRQCLTTHVTKFTKVTSLVAFSFTMRSFVLFIGVATIIIVGDEGASGVVGIAHSSKHVLIGEPSGNYNGTALIRWVHHSFFQRKGNSSVSKAVRLHIWQEFLECCISLSVLKSELYLKLDACF